MTLEAGDMLHERYQIETLLGQGGMGAVYQAFDTLLDQPCALKEFRLSILPHRVEMDVRDQEVTVNGDGAAIFILTREKAAEHFKREAKLLAALNHPNLPKVTDYFGADEEYYLVMTLIEGKDLMTVLEEHDRKPIPESEVLNWMKQVADAVAFCHQRGVIHRDIKPANVILTNTGKAYLVDFGVAKHVGHDPTTSPLMLIMTPGYSPPEQYAGQGQTDVRSDIYAFGATLYILLTGRRPLESITRVMGKELIPLHIIVPEISPRVEAAVMRALELRPADRFQTMEELKSALWGETDLSQTNTQADANDDPSSLKEEPEVLPGEDILDQLAGIAGGVDAMPPFINAEADSQPFVWLEEPFSETIPVTVQPFEIAEEQPPEIVLEEENSLKPVEVKISPRGGDYASLEEAIQRVSANSIIYLQSGEYHIQTPLLIEKSLCLIGEGMDKTHLISEQEGFLLCFRGGGIFRAHQLGFQHIGEKQANVFEVGAGEIELEQCCFKGGVRLDNLGGNGIRISGTTKGTILNCNISFNATDGIEIHGQAQLSLKANLCSHNSGSGISYSDLAGGTVFQNYCEVNGRNGIEVGGLAQPRLEANVCRSNQQAGIIYYNSAAGIAVMNHCENNELHGIQVGEQARPWLEHNTCTRNSQVGIQYLEEAAGMAQGNHCEANKLHGICVKDHAWPTLEENMCIKNKQVGIIYFGETIGIVKENRCESNSLHGIEIKGEAKPQLETNVCYRNFQVGIRFTTNTPAMALGNRCEENGLYGIEVTEHAQPRLEGNFCCKNRKVGILYSASAAGVARMNHCEANELLGIGAGGQAHPTLKTNVCRENRQSGILYTDDATGLAHGNQCLENGHHGIQVGSYAHPHIEISTCRQNGKSGIAYFDNASGIARKNECVHNTEYGIAIYGQAKPSLLENHCGENGIQEIKNNSNAY